MSNPLQASSNDPPTPKTQYHPTPNTTPPSPPSALSPSPSLPHALLNLLTHHFIHHLLGFLLALQLRNLYNEYHSALPLTAAASLEAPWPADLKGNAVLAVVSVVVQGVINWASGGGER
jgi:hypothetical protein